MWKLADAAPGDHSHTFTLVNDSPAPVRIVDVHSSCLCALPEIAGATIEPGGALEFPVELSLLPNAPDFRYSILVRTEGSVNEDVMLSIVGSLRRIHAVAASVPELNFGMLTQGEVGRRSFQVWSSRWWIQEPLLETPAVETEDVAVRHEAPSCQAGDSTDARQREIMIELDTRDGTAAACQGPGLWRRCRFALPGYSDGAAHYFDRGHPRRVGLARGYLGPRPSQQRMKGGLMGGRRLLRKRKVEAIHLA